MNNRKKLLLEDQTANLMGIVKSLLFANIFINWLVLGLIQYCSPIYCVGFSCLKINYNKLNLFFSFLRDGLGPRVRVREETGHFFANGFICFVIYGNFKNVLGIQS